MPEQRGGLTSEHVERSAPVASLRPRRSRRRDLGMRAVALLSCLLLQLPSCKSRSCDVWCNSYTCHMGPCNDCTEETGCAAKPPPPPRLPPRPSMPPFDYDKISPGAIHFEGRGGLLYGNDQQFHIKGVNWFGSENRAGPPLGLDKHPISWYMQWLKDNKFNAIRLLFNHQMILSDEPLEPPNEDVYGVGAPWEAPELAHFRYLEMFDKIAEVASDFGILILMAAHRLGPNDWPGNGLWYNGRITEDIVLQSWTKISERLCGRWNVFAGTQRPQPSLCCFLSSSLLASHLCS